MADLIYISIIVVFIAICLAYVGWCDRIIGPDRPDAVVSAATEHTVDGQVTR